MIQFYIISLDTIKYNYFITISLDIIKRTSLCKKQRIKKRCKENYIYC